MTCNLNPHPFFQFSPSLAAFAPYILPHSQHPYSSKLKLASVDMKRSYFSFVEENPNNNITNTTNQNKIPAFSRKRSKRCGGGGGGGPNDLVGLQNMPAAADMSSGRERLKRYQEEVAAHVTIPDSWGQEELLKDWIDYSPFDAFMAPKGLSSAREALAMEARRRVTNNAQGIMRIESRC